MANFCTNCGFKLENNYNYCINCGTKIDTFDIKQNNPSLNQYSDNLEKKNAKNELKRVIGGDIFSNKSFDNQLSRNGLNTINTRKAIRQQVEKEIDSGQIKSAGVEFRVNQLIIEYKIKKEEEKKILKMIDEIFESSEIKLEISNNNIGQKYISSIKDNLKNKLIDKKENMSRKEIKHFIKKEFKKAIMQEKARIARKEEEARIIREKEEAKIAREREKRRKELEWIEIHGGGYCSWDCSYCYEEFFDSHGGIVGNFDDEGYTEYCCSLGYSVSFGSLCKDFTLK
ncbi:zinc-ribbon domain-containing protein [Methanobrevibacter sp.]|uniref:zinc-ribbon domain-containing protein n=1 Tax=Methanobrevibacter sp. TaxID=66852 RepID=UPI0026DF984F|nr:zinc-ribbon domain-containing protein [Methanobrevibacter sp.]MDO5860881.1 zinc-ribbon domain-containing protein [Methanobrevibacter sp.]